MSAITIGCDKRNKEKPWVCRWCGDFDFDTGKSRRYAKSFRLKAEAEQFAAEQTVEFERGGRRDRPKDVSLGDYCKNWLRVRKAELRPASLENYQYTIRRLEDFFGKDCKLQDIEVKRARLFIAEQKSRTIGHEGRELSDASRKQIKQNCKSIFNTAVEDGYLKSSPFKNIKTKKLTVKRWHRVTVKEYFALLNAVTSLRVKVAYALLYTSGARLGEAFSLTWNDIDFENGKVKIANREGTADLPPFSIKDHEARRIPLPKHTIDLLTEWQTQTPEGVPYILLTKKRYELVKAKWQALRKAGKPWLNRYQINNVLRNFKVHCKKAGINPVGKLTVHTLRKCACQNWADNLPMNVTKELMGHSEITTTARYYNQIDADHEAKAARVIQQLLEAESKTSDVNLTYEPVSGRIGDGN
jgi:integrase